MKPAAVIEGLEVIEEGGGSGSASGERMAIWKDFIFNGGEGAFSESIVVAVSSGAHALYEICLSKQVANPG